jgi:predicted ATPase/DNA-binding SARP family transcriptional activator
MTGTTFRVLGPVEVRQDGRPVSGLPPRHRATLAALLVDAGRTVPADVLVERVWGGVPPGAAVTLQATVSKLRRVLEPEVAGGAWRLLVTRAPGYLLAVDDDAVDARRFAALLATGRERAGEDPAAARAAVGEALGLWRGPAYADVAAEFAAAEAARLEHLRLDALELAAELDLVLGRHAEVAERLPALVRAEPLREGLRGSLVLALYRAGRQAEALAAYEQGRRLLADELGVDPCPALQELHARVLRQDPGLLPAPPAVPAPRRAGPGEDAAPRTAALPAPLTRFVGRDRELAGLDAALGDHRLVTLTGPGGSGKTRLALEAARRRAAAGTPAVLVELAAVEHPELVAGAVAGALGVSLAGGDALAAVTGALQGRPLLLLLDNCEHLLDAAADVAARLLAGCPDLGVLVTSRQPLGLLGEAVRPCGPLAVDGADSDAVRLFLDRAALAVPALADPAPAELALVRQVCAELDGLPLALELAAACLGTLPLPEVAAGVGDRFALLTGGGRTARPHQRTLAATVQWSVDLLDPAELAVFRAVSVFSGGFAADAVEAVAAPDVGGPTRGALRGLTAASLVELDHARGRYRALETLRQYADQLLDDADRRTLHDRHAAFLVALADRLEPTLRTRDAAPGWARLDAELANVRAALDHLLATGQGTDALRLAGAVSWYWYRRGHVQEGRGRLAAALDAAPDAPSSVRVRALLGDALLAYLSGDVPGIRARTDELVRTADGVEDEGWLALALVLRGFVRALLGQPDAADVAALDTARGMAVAQSCGVPWVQAEIAMTLGQFARAAGDAEGALAHLDRAEALAAELGHSWAWASVQWVRAKVLLDLGLGAPALQSLAAMVRLASGEGDATGTLAGLLTAVGAATAAGSPRDGARLLGAVESIGRRVGYDPLRMDPADGARYVAAVHAALPGDDRSEAVAAGRALDLAGAVELVAELAARAAPAGDAGSPLSAGAPPASRAG